MDREPVLSVASVTAAVTAVIALVVAFGVDLSNDQQTAILGVVSVAAPLVVIVARRYTWSPESVANVVEGMDDVTGDETI